MGWKETTWGLFKYSVLIAWRVSKSTSTFRHSVPAPLELARMPTSVFSAFTSLFQLGYVKLFPLSHCSYICPTGNFKSWSFTNSQEKEANHFSLTLKRCPNLKTKVRNTALSWPRKHVSTSRPPTTPFTLPFLSLKNNIARRFYLSWTQLSSVAQMDDRTHLPGWRDKVREHFCSTAVLLLLTAPW